MQQHTYLDTVVIDQDHESRVYNARIRFVGDRETQFRVLVLKPENDEVGIYVNGLTDATIGQAKALRSALDEAIKLAEQHQ